MIDLQHSQIPIVFTSQKKRKIKPKLRRHILHLFQKRCIYCGSNSNLTIEHLIPVSRGGMGKRENLAVSCQSCNTDKDNATHTEYIKRKGIDDPLIPFLKHMEPSKPEYPAQVWRMAKILRELGYAHLQSHIFDQGRKEDLFSSFPIESQGETIQLALF